MAVLRRDKGQKDYAAYLNVRYSHEAQQILAKSRVFNPNLSGIAGPKGTMGQPGPPGKETYMLSYCGIHVKVPLDKSTFDLIDDATELNGDDLQLIKMVNEQDWNTIREAWAEQWQKNKAYAAFEGGFQSDDYDSNGGGHGREAVWARGSDR